MLRGFGDFDSNVKGCGTTPKDVAGTQAMLNLVGATDASGKKLAEDGQWGSSSQAAFDKFAANFAANKNLYAAQGVALTACEALLFDGSCAAAGSAAPSDCAKVPRFGAPPPSQGLPADAPPVAGPTSQFFEIQRWQQYLNKRGCKVNEQGLWDDKTDAASKAVLDGKPCPGVVAVQPASRVLSPVAIQALRAAFQRQATVPSTAAGKPAPVTVSISGKGRVSRVSAPSSAEPSTYAPVGPAPGTQVPVVASLSPDSSSAESDNKTLFILGGIALAAVAAGGIYFALKQKG